MRILLVAYSCAPGLGSESGNSWHWACGLAERGHTVHVLTHARERTRIGDAWRSAPAGVHLHFHGFELQERLGMRLGYVSWHLGARRRAQALVGRYDLDVAHHVSWATASSPTVASRLTCPFVWGPLGGGQRTPLSFWRDLGAIPAAREAARSFWLGLAPAHPALRATARRASVALPTNDDTYELLRRLGALRISFFPQTGVDADWVAAPSASRDDVPEVLWAGTLEPRKAPLLALDVFAEVARRRPAHLVMAGAGPLAGACRAKIEELGLTDRVRLVGHLSQNDLRRHLLRCQAMLFTSLRDSFPTIVLEALGCGAPLVALAHQSLRSLPDDVFLRVPVVSPAQVRRDCATALLRLLDQGELRQRLSGSARAYVEAEHLWSHRLDAIEAIYRTV